jgi:hypothetical protein
LEPLPGLSIVVTQEAIQQAERGVGCGHVRDL